MDKRSIEEGFSKMQQRIDRNTAFLTAIPAFVEIAGKNDGKVLNKRFTDQLKDSLLEGIGISEYKLSYLKDYIDVTIYLKGFYSISSSHTFRFAIADCFTETESGKLRIKAEAFRDSLKKQREDIVSENAATRADIDKAYNMLVDAAELVRLFDEYRNKYSYQMLDDFKVNYWLKTY